jgi:XTP/dITP diphosphohydrolase
VKTIVLATKNPGKVKEILQIFNGLPFEFKSLFDFPDIPEILEDGTTFEQNALKKAREVFQRTHLVTLSDDSGLEVAVLGNRPGVYSARYAGEGASDEANNNKLLQELENIPFDSRTAQFRCVAALVSEGEEYLSEGICTGKIAYAPRGTNGFGYDPLFIPTGYQQTFAELSEEVKNRISHRGKAFRTMKKILTTLR